MATSRPFAYNPIPPGSEISGTTQFVNLAIGVLNEQYDANYGGVKWWQGPDEDLGYIICQPIPPNTQPTPISGLTASVGFYRTTAFTDSAFLLLCNKLPARKNQPKFQTTNEALVWLTANGYWTNYIAQTPTPTPTLTPTPTTTSTYYYYSIKKYDCNNNCTYVSPDLVGRSVNVLSTVDGMYRKIGSFVYQVQTEIIPSPMSFDIDLDTATSTNLNCATACGEPTPTGTPTPTPTSTPSSAYTLTLSSCSTGNATYALGGSFVNGDIVEVKATFSGTGNAGVNNSNATLFLGTTGVATGSTCFTPTTFMSWNLSLTGTLTFSGGTTVFVRSLAENAAASSVNASTSLEITKINGVTVTGISAVGCWAYSTGSPCTP
jgi:hypothetical protein